MAPGGPLLSLGLRVGADTPRAAPDGLRGPGGAALRGDRLRLRHDGAGKGGASGGQNPRRLHLK